MHSPTETFAVVERVAGTESSRPRSLRANVMPLPRAPLPGIAASDTLGAPGATIDVAMEEPMRVWSSIFLLAVCLSLHTLAVAAEGADARAASRKPEVVVVYWSSED